MLILARMEHGRERREWIEIVVRGEVICIGAVQVKGKRVRIGIDAPRSVRIERVHTLGRDLPSKNPQAVIREVYEKDQSRRKRMGMRSA